MMLWLVREGLGGNDDVQCYAHAPATLGRGGGRAPADDDVLGGMNRNPTRPQEAT